MPLGHVIWLRGNAASFAVQSLRFFPQCLQFLFDRLGSIRMVIAKFSQLLFERSSPLAQFADRTLRNSVLTRGRWLTRRLHPCANSIQFLFQRLSLIWVSITKIS